MNSILAVLAFICFVGMCCAFVNLFVPISREGKRNLAIAVALVSAVVLLREGLNIIGTEDSVYEFLIRVDFSSTVPLLFVNVLVCGALTFGWGILLCWTHSWLNKQALAIGGWAGIIVGVVKLMINMFVTFDPGITPQPFF